LLVSPGDFAAFVTEPCEFVDGCFKAKAVDARRGCAVLLKLLESNKKPKSDTYFVFTVQEEVGARGATAATYTVNPTTAVVIESTTAADVPGVSGEKRVCLMGGGPVINFMDKGTIYSPELYTELRMIADGLGMSWQVKRLLGRHRLGKIHVRRAGVLVRDSPWCPVYTSPLRL
jgi:endoglucanase